MPTEAIELEVGSAHRSGLEPGQGLLPGQRAHEARSRPVLPLRRARGSCARSTSGRRSSGGFPDGVEGEAIYQKRVPEKRPDWIETARVTFPSGRHADELCVTEVAQVALGGEPRHRRLPPVAVAPHATPSIPTSCGSTSTRSRERRSRDGKRVAAVVRETLAEIGYTGWPKTSGNRGIHIACRIEPTLGASRSCAAPRSPSRARSSGARRSSSRPRGGRRSAASASSSTTTRTRATARSRRPTRRAPGATRPCRRPVTWDELPDVETEDFTLATMPARFAKLGDVQAGIDDVVCDLRVLLEWVERDESAGLAEAPYPPNFPKMPGEPPRVQPSRAKKT